MLLGVDTVGKAMLVFLIGLSLERRGGLARQYNIDLMAVITQLIPPYPTV